MGASPRIAILSSRPRQSFADGQRYSALHSVATEWVFLSPAPTNFPQRRASENTIRIAKRFKLFIVVVKRRLNDRRLRAGRIERGGEIARLALEFRRVERCIAHGERTCQTV